VKDLHHRGEDHHGSEKAEQEIQDYLAFLGFEKKHKRFLLIVIKFLQS